MPRGTAPAVAILALSFVIALLPVTQSEADVNSEQAVAYLNQERAANGIPGDLVNRPDWANGCAKHNSYMNSIDELTHYEDPASPYYTPQGAEAGAGSVLAYGGYGWSGQWPWPGNNPWEWGPIHLYTMLNPARTSAGYNESYGYACMQFFGEEASSREPSGEATFYSYPGPGTSGIYPTEEAGEFPYTPQELVGIPTFQPTGPNILLFSMGAGTDLTADSFSLDGPQGPVASQLVVQSTSHTVDSGLGNGSWFAGGGVLIPEHPLAQFTTYTATINWRNSSNQTFNQDFSFTTGAQPSESKGGQVVARPKLHLKFAFIHISGQQVRVGLRLSPNFAESKGRLRLIAQQRKHRRVLILNDQLRAQTKLGLGQWRLQAKFVPKLTDNWRPTSVTRSIWVGR